MKRAHKGFTLIEVLVTIVILGFVAAIALGSYSAAVQRSRFDTARAVLEQIYQGEQNFSVGISGNGTFFPDPVGIHTGCNGDLTCIASWRKNLSMDDPNAIPLGLVGSVIYIVVSGASIPGGPVDRFTATASYRGQAQTVNEAHLFCPPCPTCPKIVGVCSWERL